MLVPFGGSREEWAALELGAWLARENLQGEVVILLVAPVTGLPIPD